MKNIDGCLWVTMLLYYIILPQFKHLVSQTATFRLSANSAWSHFQSSNNGLVLGCRQVRWWATVARILSMDLDVINTEKRLQYHKILKTLCHTCLPLARAWREKRVVKKVGRRFWHPKTLKRCCRQSTRINLGYMPPGDTYLSSPQKKKLQR